MIMETFIVLGLCFILYEALDFFQGCMHSAPTNPAIDQIDAYQRQLNEQKQQQQQEQFLANITPLLDSLTLSSSQSSLQTTTPTASTASVISDLRATQFPQSQHQDYSASTPALNGNTVDAGFRLANSSVYESQELFATSSLPRDYYHIQKQQLRNKISSKSILSKLGSSTDNRIYPEGLNPLGVPPSAIITQQPLLCSPVCIGREAYTIPSSLNSSKLTVDNCNSVENKVISTSVPVVNQKTNKHSLESEEDYSSLEEDSCSSSSASGDLRSRTYDSDHNEEECDDEKLNIQSCSSSHSDFREIECERLRRKCVSVKRIYSISEKF